MKRTTAFSCILLTVLMSIIVLSGCKDEENKPAPEIPPVSTLSMDFSGFPDTDTLSQRDMETYHNWWWAATNVFVWNTFVTIGMAIPVASFMEAFNHEAIYDPDSDNWTWSYNFTAGGIVHLASLHASIVTDSVLWQMYISRQNSYTDFLWYYGKSSLLATGGYWIMYKNAFDPQPLLNITWHRNPALGTEDIKYTNISPGDAENGGYISYAVTTDTPYDAFYDIFNKGKDNLTSIEWKRPDLEGRITDPMHFGDMEWHCWNQLHQDILCE